MGASAVIYLVRHGQTESNRRRVLLGRGDPPLDETGLRQAAETAARLEGIPFDRVYTSPLRRAAQTAALIAPDVPAAADERLLEMDCGPYEGMPLDDPAPEVLAFFRDLAHTGAPAGMEPLQQVTARAGAFLRELHPQPGERILVSTHAVLMKGMLEYLTPGADGRFWSAELPNCAVYVTEYREDSGYSVPRRL